MAITTNGIKESATKSDKKKWLMNCPWINKDYLSIYLSIYLSKDEDSPKASSQCKRQTSLPSYSTSLKTKRYGEKQAIATIQVTRMKNGQSFELMSGERRGNTTAPNRPTAMRSRLWIDTALETYVKKWASLHKAWPRGPSISQESV